MSSIYNLEPPTKGKVILKTSVGDIEIELWSKECPKSCRNFIQLCMEGYYNQTIFHRVVKDFIVQGGDPTGTGEGGESIYGEPFMDEFHSRLRFNRRGLIGMANSQANDNASQFFFTLGPCAELNKKHTLFGKIGGATVYNMIKLNESELIGESPVRAEKVFSAEIIYNPFEDIVARSVRAQRKVEEIKVKEKGVKNFGLLSFGDEAEEDEEIIEDVTENYKSKSKSAHDIGDPSLLSNKLEKPEKNSSSSGSSESESDEEQMVSEKKSSASIDLDSIKSKLKKKNEMTRAKLNETARNTEKLNEKDVKKSQTKEEIKRIQRELAGKDKAENNRKEEMKEKKEETKIVKEYKEDVEKYEHLKKKKVTTKVKSKEEKTLELLNSFRKKLFDAKEQFVEMDTNNLDVPDKKSEDDTPFKSTDLYTHRLEMSEEIKQKVIDASVADQDRWDIYDPRNPLNKRKLEESKNIMKDAKRSGSSYSHNSSNRSNKR